MKINRNEPCPCGSRIKYKNCCKEKVGHIDIDRTNVIEVKKMIARELESARINECIHPLKTECSNTIVKAHSIQNNRVLTVIADNGYVMMFKPKLSNDGSHSRPTMEPVGRGVATTFKGFCQYHDKTTFAPIEDTGFNGSDEQCFLFAYRAFAYDRHKKLEQINVLRQGIKKMPQMLQNSDIVFFYRGNQAAEQDFRNLKKAFDDAIINKNFDILETTIIKLEWFASIAVSSAPFIQYDISGNLLNDLNSLKVDELKFSMITVFPEDNSTYILISWLKKDSKFFANFKHQLLSLDLNGQLNILNNLIPYHSENFAISPSLWKSFGTKAQNELINVFYGENRNIYYMPKDGLTKKRSYNLFRSIMSY